ncbi:FAD/NAD(P)-binding domain-containing protein [Annulohypoxylon maeteangense]|uniref:FAD/NAD(P)-binding domain-containing protein n=1 Tax=Annulohypoxylon maeteangense TaxID=1927788 RepID=UPI002007D9F6|nr:FAD/NAD(P)-binding domain-containing protein [Annulohypoxylon maeteangense]KAI0889450.1 FAD/NAD(P)-binding domain-containing protein [Annulohypoxylon maeteangense]
MTSSDQPVLIIGAGVAGLTLAQGLRLRSIPFRLFERHPQSHSSQGHRFRISRDSQAALNSVLSPQLQALLKRTAADQFLFKPRYVDAKKLDFAKLTPVDPDTMAIDRTWIRMLTTLGLEQSVEYGKEFRSYEIVDGQVQVKFTDGSAVSGRLLVGADGIRSRVRKQLQPNRKLLDLERSIMWGRTLLTDDLKENIPQDMLSWCMYLDQETNVQVVVEPMIWSKSVRQESDAKLPDFPDYVFWVVCTASSQYSELLPKTVEEKKLFLEKVTKTWHPALKLLLDSATHDLSACAPVLSSKPDIEISSVGQPSKLVTLVGDAAHAMSPMGGSGGATAILNAADLARIIAEEGITKGSIANFEARMEEKAKDMIEHSFRGGQKFWRGKEWSEYSETDV